MDRVTTLPVEVDTVVQVDDHASALISLAARSE